MHTAVPQATSRRPAFGDDEDRVIRTPLAARASFSRLATARELGRVLSKAQVSVDVARVTPSLNKTRPRPQRSHALGIALRATASAAI
jgi:hypothetical protein